ncbi:MAG: DUF4358 domain-containing protein [Anaerovoracaceae bacterium]|jgi:hypothetical protein
MKIYKTLILSMLILLTLIISTACSHQEIEIDTSLLAQSLVSHNTYQDKLSPIGEKAFYALYGIDEANDYLDDFQVYVSTGATAEEVAVLTATETSKAKTLGEAVNRRISAQIEGFENYVPKEVEKLMHPVLITKGKYVILCVSNHNEKADEIIGEFLK